MFYPTTEHLNLTLTTAKMYLLWILCSTFDSRYIKKSFANSDFSCHRESKLFSFEH